MSFNIAATSRLAEPCEAGSSLTQRRDITESRLLVERGLGAALQNACVQNRVRGEFLNRRRPSSFRCGLTAARMSSSESFLMSR